MTSAEDGNGNPPAYRQELAIQAHILRWFRQRKMHDLARACVAEFYTEAVQRANVLSHSLEDIVCHTLLRISYSGELQRQRNRSGARFKKRKLARTSSDNSERLANESRRSINQENESVVTQPESAALEQEVKTMPQSKRRKHSKEIHGVTAVVSESEIVPDIMPSTAPHRELLPQANPSQKVEKPQEQATYNAANLVSTKSIPERPKSESRGHDFHSEAQAARERARPPHSQMQDNKAHEISQRQHLSLKAMEAMLDSASDDSD